MALMPNFLAIGHGMAAGMTKNVLKKQQKITSTAWTLWFITEQQQPQTRVQFQGMLPDMY